VNQKPKSTAERIKDAQQRAEDAMTYLLENVEDYANAQSSSSRADKRRNILRSARRYGRAMDQLTVVRR
jgi:hypothetical protein